MFIKSQLEFLRNKKLALACSGGADSMVLAHLLLKSKLPFSIIHCNFQLRGEDSFTDENFVKSFAESNQISIFIRRFDTLDSANENQISIEMEARNLRYAYFEELIKQEKFDLFLLAHHADDQAETISMRMLKGAGLLGLTGMKKVRDEKYCRPLLQISKEDILSYARENQIKHIEDASNLETIYQRNKIRNQIFPLVKEINPSYREALEHLGDLSAQTLSLLDDNFSYLNQDWKTKGEVNLNVIATKSYLSLVLSYLLEGEIAHKSILSDIRKSISSSESKFFKLTLGDIEVKNFVLKRIIKNPSEPKVFSSINELALEKKINVQVINEVPLLFQEGHLYFDIEKIKFPILLRPMADGDKINAYGMGSKSRKVSDIAQEANWSKTKKMSNSILLDSNKEIIAILGYRISEKVKIDSKTKQILIIN
ncbi:MAG: tRNA lysidine(34) synthetase TilS [Chitinophagales bacterium]